MREKWGVPEMVVTVMQSIIALALVNYLCAGPWKEPTGYIKRTPAIPTELALPSEFGLGVFFIIGLIMIPIVHMLINRTTLGYEMRVVGYNKKIAIPHKLNVTKLVVLSMFLSGGICGLTGAGIVTGEIYRMQVGLTGNFGFYAIAALFMAREKAKYTIFSSFLLAVIYQGVLGLATLGIPRLLGDMLIGITFIVAILPEIRLRLKR
jgi:simple sugar transport system permease protein